MDALVVGGGIGGLATAAFLQHHGMDAQVYEQAPTLQPVGAGIVLAPNAVRLLRRLGLMATLERDAVRVRTGWEFRRWENGQVLLAQDMDRCATLYGEAAWLVHRADLLEVLLGAVDPSTVHLGHRLCSVEATPSGVTARFGDGLVAGGDLLVAADGIHSAVRHQLVGPVAARASGLCAWRATLPGDRLDPRYTAPTQTLWLGPGRHLVHYPVSGGRRVNVVAFTPAPPDVTAESWTAAGDPAEFRAEFAGWDATVTDLLDAVTEVGRWAVLDRAPIDRYVHGRVVLLGDAAHPMLPFFAQGAGQAIEDAAALATALAEAGPVAAALEVYERVRVPRTAQVQEASHGRATVNHLPDGAQQRARDLAFAGDDPLRHSEWLYAYDAQDAVRTELDRKGGAGVRRRAPDTARTNPQEVQPTIVAQEWS